MAITNIKSLFTLNKKQNGTAAAGTTSATNNPDNIQIGETYIAYGRRMCGKVNGSEVALTPLVQRVYFLEKQRQQNDEQLQQTHRQRLQEEIIDLQRSIDQNNIEQDHKKTVLNQLNDEKIQLENKLETAKGNIGDSNKMARIKMIIGLSILVILTVYLFVFYSSTFFSAFFKNFDVIDDDILTQAMFDSKALPMALSKGLGSLVFICSAPIIFMGLGYLLHFYSVEKGKMKYLKIAITVAITFVFDCILAYLIAKKIYDLDIMSKPGEFPPFGLKMAISDINVWAVIFCGFITYMIWGFVFDLTMSAYDELKTNRKEINSIENEIKHVDEQRDSINNEISRLRTKKAELESDKRSKENRLSHQTYIWDEDVIMSAMNDFFSGWITVMTPLGHSVEQQEICRREFNQTINHLINN